MDNPNIDLELKDAKLQFVNQWGSMGSAWGINRTMAQIQGLLLVSDQALTTDDVMEYLTISRGNAHTNLKELVQWQLAFIETVPGDRKDYFRGEKDPWKIFCAIAKERKRRELEPTINVLESFIAATEASQSPEAKSFQNQMQALVEFIEFADKSLDSVLKTKHPNMLRWIMSRLS